MPGTDGKTSATVTAVKTNVLKDGGIPYRPIFNDLDTIFDDIKQEMTMVKSKQFSDKIQDEEKKIKKGTALAGLDLNVAVPSRKGKDKEFARLREYVDLALESIEKREQL